MNLLMIIADTVRSDFLGVHGGYGITPHLDRLAQGSVDFRRMRAASFPTVPARADYLTGTFALTSIGWGPLPGGIETVPEKLQKIGVTTAAVVDTPFYTVKGYNYDRGFNYFDEVPLQDRMRLRGRRPVGTNRLLIPSPEVSEFDLCAPTTMTRAEIALEQLALDKEPFFLFVDTWDPHEPWSPPAWYVKQYLAHYDGRVVAPPYARLENTEISGEDLEVARACYAGKLTMVDRWIGRLLDRLETLGLANDTAVLFISDHGHYFGEHGIFGKMVADDYYAKTTERHWLRSPLYSEVAEIPFFVKVPGAEPRTDVGVASAIDVAPTILELLGAEASPNQHGKSLLGRVYGGRGALSEPEEVAITAMPLAIPGAPVAVVDDTTRYVKEWQPITVTSNDWTMLYTRLDDPVELYPSGVAESEESECAEANPSVVAALRGALQVKLTQAGASAEDLKLRFE